MLVFNERNEIVITNPVGFMPTTSYLVPKPDTRIELAEIVADVPAGFEPVHTGSTCLRNCVNYLRLALIRTPRTVAGAPVSNGENVAFIR